MTKTAWNSNEGWKEREAVVAEPPTLLGSLLLLPLRELAFRFIPEAGPDLALSCKAWVCSELEELSCWTTLPANSNSHSFLNPVMPLFCGHPSENTKPESWDNCVVQESAPCTAANFEEMLSIMVMFDIRSKFMVPGNASNLQLTN